MKDSFTYIAREKCGCINAMAVDCPFTNREALADDIAQWIKEGRTVERMTTEQAKEEWGKANIFDCKCGTPLFKEV